MRIPFGPRTATRGLALTLATFAITIDLTGCSINPATGHLDTLTMSESKEVKMGKELHEEMAKNVPFYEDEALNAYVSQVGQRVAAAGDRPDLEYHFFIIDSPDINAFALPGGYIYINRGLINYLNNEAQLAAVLGHEVAHVTARHHARQKSAKTGRNIGAVFAGLLTGSYTVASAAAQWSDAAIAGYGRDMELEADGFGAKYLRKAGYEPQAMIDVLSLLKAHERFIKVKNREAGKPSVSYHGVFTTHPQSDQRLHEAVNDGADGDSKTGDKNVEQFRAQTDGLVWGENYDRPSKPAEEEGKTEDDENKENRYTHNRLGFTLVYPKDWQVANQQSAIVGAAVDDSAKITLTVAQVDPKANFETLLRDQFKVRLLRQSEALTQHGLRGHTGIMAEGNSDSRIAILVQGNRAYWLQGEVIEADQDVDYDALFMETIRSFQPVRPRAPQRVVAKHSQSIKYVQANDNTTFARLALDLKLGKYGEEYLRLINGYYPRGEPYPGEVIKIIQ